MSELTAEIGKQSWLFLTDIAQTKKNKFGKEFKNSKKVYIFKIGKYEVEEKNLSHVHEIFLYFCYDKKRCARERLT